ncbi:GtrA family protein [Duganella sp.]|uniref:GtrA family protein n=1 Tax=Duganella sp. TaxID=1904440 RepID=UPI0031D217B8
MSRTRSELLRFAVAGVAGLVVDVCVLYLALGIGLGYYAGRVLSFLAAVYATWRINRRYTFAASAGESAWREWWRYLFAMLGGGLVNYGAYSAVVALLPPHPLLPLAAVAAGSLAGMSVNFVGAKYFVFRRSTRP